MAEKKRRTGKRARGGGLWTEGPGGLPEVKPMPGQLEWEAMERRGREAEAKARLDAERAARTPDPDALTGWEEV